MRKPNEKTIKKIIEIQKAYENEGRLTLRRIYYILLSKGLIKHSENSYKGLSVFCVKWREAGIINPEWIVDRHRDLVKRTTYSNFQEAFNNLCRNYSRNSMDNQERYVEVWIEKDTMSHIFLNGCVLNDVPLITSKGFTSYSFKHEAVERFKQQNKPITILYFGDFDAEGEHIPKVFHRFIKEKAPELDLNFKKILLTEKDIPKIKQFAVYDKSLSNPIHQRKNYVLDFLNKYGKQKYEVEALSFDEVQKRFLQALAQEINLQVVENNENESQEEIKNWKLDNMKNV